MLKCLASNEEGAQSISQIAGCNEHTVSSFVWSGNAALVNSE